MNILFRNMKPLAIVLLAFLAALAVTLGAIQLRAWRSGKDLSSANGMATTSPSDDQKLAILASLSASSSATIAEKSKTLRSLSIPANKNPSDAEKLQILQALH